MEKRGVTRPQMKKDENSGGMNPAQRHQMLVSHHRNTQWVYWMLVLLGVWLIATPLTFQFSKEVVAPAGGRELWISLNARLSLFFWSDIISGFLLILLGFRAVKPDRPLSLWIACIIGVWLNAAPLLFWAPNPLIYLNDTLVGSLVIALTILIPGMPNMINYMKMGPEQPPGWSYNPSSWPQRAVMIALGFAGWLVSRYLGAFQLGYFENVWDPFFGEASRKVLTSKMSEMWPISDGGLGAFSYTFEFLMGWMGSPSRWRTMPWMVTFFGILVIPLGLTHIFLVISQPVVVGHWCTMCLLAALIMLPMIPLEVDEVVAMIQFLQKARKQGKPFWRTFWKGDTLEDGGEDKRSPGIMQIQDKPAAIFKASIWGMSFPLTLLVAAALGVWTMAVPGIFGSSGMAAHIEHLAGALIVTTSVIAMGEVVRSLRFFNLLLGAVLVIGPWLLGGAATAGMISDILVGLLVIGLSLPRGRVREQYGSWNRYIK
ncbi:MAG: vitamin K epoxide reductase family protein [Calditrichia bacterium]